MPMIKETFVLTATNTDVLAAPSRLTSIPAAGTLQLEISSTDCDASNYAEATLQLPGGEIPFENLRVPANGYSTADNVVHNDTELYFEVPVDKGGHVLLQITETGTVAQLMIIATFMY